MLWIIALPLFAPQDTEVAYVDFRPVLAPDLPTGGSVDPRPAGGLIPLDEWEVAPVVLDERRASGAKSARWGSIVCVLFPGVVCDLDRGVLRVEGTSEDVGRVRSFVGDLTRDAGRRVDVLAIPLPSDTPLPSSAVLDKAACQSLLDRLEPSHAILGSSYPGKQVTLGSQERQALLYEYDMAHFAQHLAGDPKVSLTVHGGHFALCADPCTDGRWYVRVFGHASEEASPDRQVPVGTNDQCVVQLPQSRGVGLASSAILEDGGALVMGSHGHPRGAWLFQVERAGSWAETPIVDYGSATSAPFQFWLRPLSGPRTAGGSLWPEDFWDEVPADLAEAPFKYDGLLDSALNLEGVDHFGWRAVCRGSESRVEVLRAVSQVESLRGPCIALEVRFGLVPPALFEQYGARIPAEALARALPGRALLASRSGDSASAQLIWKRWYVRDHDVHIGGGGKAVPDPIIADLLSGFSVACLPLADPFGNVSLWAEFHKAVDHGDRTIPVFPLVQGSLPGDDEMAPIQHATHVALPRVSHATCRRLLHTPDGDPALLFQGAIEGVEGVFAVTITPTVIR